MVKQREEMSQQSFDSKFFQMINLLNEIKHSLVINANNQVYKGSEVFVFLKEKFESKIENEYTNDKNNSIFNIKFNYFINSFNHFNDDYETTFKYYFINLYQIMKFIDKDIPKKEYSKKYMNILRAQLSKNELILLCYNAIGIREKCGDNYKNLIEKYSFLEHLQYENFCTNFKVIKINNILLSYYDINAFGKNTSVPKSVFEN